MSDYILNLLPVNEAEKEEFEAIAPEAVHVYAGRRTVTPEQLERATILFGWPRPADLPGAKHLKWFQTMWAGTEEYAGKVPQGALFTSSSGSNSRSVAEHMLACLLALCRRLPTYRDAQRDRRWKDEGAMKTIVALCLLFCAVMLVVTHTLSPLFVRLFTSNPDTIARSVRYIKIFTCMILPLAIQYPLVDEMTALAQVGRALYCSLARKAIFLACLLLLPALLGPEATFFAEPIADLLAAVNTAIFFARMFPRALETCRAGQALET